MKLNELLEAFQAGDFPEYPDLSDEFQQGYSKVLDTATKVADIRKNYALYKNNEIYMLVRNDGIIAGMLRLRNEKIAGKDYLSVVVIFVPKEFRKGPALYWLLYAVKETVNKDVIADGAIFTDGQALVDAIQKHNMFYVFDLNKETGEVSEITSPIRSSDHCYLFRTTKLGFGEQIFTEGMSFTWYPLFGEIEE
jgi:hypothetical protein